MLWNDACARGVDTARGPRYYCQRVCAALGIMIEVSSEVISLVKLEQDRTRLEEGHEYAIYENCHTVEEAWAFLRGYCRGTDGDVWKIIDTDRETRK